MQSIQKSIDSIVDTPVLDAHIEPQSDIVTVSPAKIPEQDQSPLHLDISSQIPNIPNIAKDGSCLFHSIGTIFNGDKYDENADIIRREICDVMRDDVFFHAFLLPDDDSSPEDVLAGHTHHQYIHKMRQSGEYGNHPEIIAASSLYQTRFIVLESGRPAHVCSASDAEMERTAVLLRAGQHYRPISFDGKFLLPLNTSDDALRQLCIDNGIITHNLPADHVFSTRVKPSTPQPFEDVLVKSFTGLFSAFSTQLASSLQLSDLRTPGSFMRINPTLYSLLNSFFFTYPDHPFITDLLQHLACQGHDKQGSIGQLKMLSDTLSVHIYVFINDKVLHLSPTTKAPNQLAIILRYTPGHFEPYVGGLVTNRDDLISGVPTVDQQCYEGPDLYSSDSPTKVSEQDDRHIHHSELIEPHEHGQHVNQDTLISSDIEVPSVDTLVGDSHSDDQGQVLTVTFTGKNGTPVCSGALF
eukprot:gnl/Dysnectes_brevis/1868_a2146_1310.p2 GENE.gnl/Dysnectes_brevis/1868_a2146_1310~~gnl/Dysnectes_brevis/1868_a2146_1310.p2  ORF type:complete len:468 (-),score=25.44 gnl/Dysnectes_brevis/1868_a2146_1310:2710-4113(-)